MTKEHIKLIIKEPFEIAQITYDHTQHHTKEAFKTEDLEYWLFKSCDEDFFPLIFRVISKQQNKLFFLILSQKFLR